MPSEVNSTYFKINDKIIKLNIYNKGKKLTQNRHCKEPTQETKKLQQRSRSKTGTVSKTSRSSS